MERDCTDNLIWRCFKSNFKFDFSSSRLIFYVSCEKVSNRDLDLLEWEKRRAKKREVRDWLEEIK